jgi:hypothetical protein
MTVNSAIKKFDIPYKKKTGSNYKIISKWPEDFSSEQKQIISGCLLGDGWLYNQSFWIKQCRRRREYIEHVSNCLKPYTTGNIYDGEQCNRSKVFLSSECYTRKAPRFANLETIWYPSGKKIVPRDIELTPLTCAHWFVQDGCNRKSRKTAILYTNSFLKKDVCFLIDKLKHDIGIDSYLRKEKLNQWSVAISNKDEHYSNFINTIKPFVKWNCFQYKVDQI